MKGALAGAIQQQHAAEGDPAPAGERADGHQQQGEHERGDDQGEQFVEVDHGRVLWRAVWAAETVGARPRQIAGCALCAAKGNCYLEIISIFCLYDDKAAISQQQVPVGSPRT